MKAAYTPMFVHEAAIKAEAIWQELFDARKERWIAGLAVRRRGFFDRRPFGREYAEKAFTWGGFTENAGHNGVFWNEAEGLEITQRLTFLTERAGQQHVILTQNELWALYP